MVRKDKKEIKGVQDKDEEQEEMYNMKKNATNMHSNSSSDLNIQAPMRSNSKQEHSRNVNTILITEVQSKTN